MRVKKHENFTGYKGKNRKTEKQIPRDKGNTTTTPIRTTTKNSLQIKKKKKSPSLSKVKTPTKHKHEHKHFSQKTLPLTSDFSFLFFLNFSSILFALLILFLVFFFLLLLSSLANFLSCTHLSFLSSYLFFCSHISFTSPPLFFLAPFLFSKPSFFPKQKKKLTGVGNGDVVDLIGIKPDLVLAAAQDAGSQTLLKPQADHFVLPGGERGKKKGLVTLGSKVVDFLSSFLLCPVSLCGSQKDHQKCLLRALL